MKSAKYAADATPYQLGYVADPTDSEAHDWRKFNWKAHIKQGNALYEDRTGRYTRRSLFYSFCDKWQERYGHGPGIVVSTIFLCGEESCTDPLRAQRVTKIAHEAGIEIYRKHYLLERKRLEQFSCIGMDRIEVPLTALLKDHTRKAIGNLCRDWLKHHKAANNSTVVYNSEIAEADHTVSESGYRWSTTSDPRVDSKLLWALLRKTKCGQYKVKNKIVSVMGDELVMALLEYDYSQRETAQAFGVHEDSVGRWLRCLRKAMRKYNR